MQIGNARFYNAHYAMNSIRQLRKETHLTQRVLAFACDVDEATVRRWEQGRQGVTPRHQRKLAKVLGVTIADLQLEDHSS